VGRDVDSAVINSDTPLTGSKVRSLVENARPSSGGDGTLAQAYVWRPEGNAMAKVSLPKASVDFDAFEFQSNDILVLP
jgi:hypothetical protein